MYQALAIAHNYVRWFVLASLLFAMYRSYKGYRANATFTKTDNLVRHWAATIAHIQLLIGMLLYFRSPVIKYFWSNFTRAVADINNSFFGLIHILSMLTAIVIITAGSAMAKRKQTDKEKFKTILVWFSIALTIIFIAIPWPFSPFANRPYLR